MSTGCLRTYDRFLQTEVKIYCLRRYSAAAQPVPSEVRNWYQTCPVAVVGPPSTVPVAPVGNVAISVPEVEGLERPAPQVEISADTQLKLSGKPIKLN